MHRSRIRRAARLFSLVSLLMGALHLTQLRSSLGIVLWLAKVVAEALSPWLALLGAAGALLGLVSRAPLAVAAGATGAWASARYVWRTVTSAADFQRAFGPDWQQRIPEERRAPMLKGRWTWFLAADPDARWTRDVVYAHVRPSPPVGDPPSASPGRSPDRPLLCDVWRPPAQVTPSRLAVVYLHGGAWFLGDKDLGTRPLFRHLAAQGHVIVDVAYRLSPEASIPEMVHDAKRAVAWVKANAGRYGVDPERVVLSGGSAGAHLALLAAYTPHHPDLTPPELAGTDLTVAGVAAFYGPVDLHATAEFNPSLVRTGEQDAVPVRPVPAYGESGWWAAMWELMRGGVPAAHELAGCAPDELPAMYALGSPVNHVDASCPPTLLLHGTHDFLVPVESTRELYHKLLAAGVPAVYLELPESDHAFDFLLPRLSPPAQAAWYELERFLALLE